MIKLFVGLSGSYLQSSKEVVFTYLVLKELNVATLMISLLDRVENSVGKEENAGYQHFLLFLQCFPKPSSFGLFKVPIAPNYKGVCLQNTSKPCSYHLKIW